jgi:soluble lytic murein transglycosylase-like protein
LTAAALGLLLLLQEPDVGKVADLAEARAAELGRNKVSATQAGEIAEATRDASRRFQVPVVVLLAFIESESAYGTAEVSSAHCKGLMQLNPTQLRTFARLAGLRRPRIANIHDNIMMGAAYVRYLWDRYGRLDHAASAYNRGEGLFERQGKPVGRYARSVMRRLPMLQARLTPQPLSAMVAE